MTERSHSSLWYCWHSQPCHRLCLLTSIFTAIKVLAHVGSFLYVNNWFLGRIPKHSVMISCKVCNRVSVFQIWDDKHSAKVIYMTALELYVTLFRLVNIKLVPYTTSFTKQNLFSNSTYCWQKWGRNGQSTLLSSNAATEAVFYCIVCAKVDKPLKNSSLSTTLLKTYDQVVTEGFRWQSKNNNKLNSSSLQMRNTPVTLYKIETNFLQYNSTFLVRATTVSQNPSKYSCQKIFKI